MHRWAVLAVLLFIPLTTAQTGDVFPSHDDVLARLEAASAMAPDWIDVQDVGFSGEGRALKLAVITDPNSTVPMDERVVTLLLTQQHGNEPAGTPAVLDLVDAIAAGEAAADFMANQILLVQPMGNPDGATANQRANAADTDLNRDHVHLTQPETQAVHALFTAWDIHVGVDHHEYSGTGLGSPVPVRTYDYDATVLYPRHGNVRAPTVEAAKDLQYEGLYPAAEEAGYTIGDYGVQTAAGIPVDHLAGGPDPGILRNNFGLNNIAGLLVESFVPLAPNPTIDGERRTDVHRVIMEGTLAYVSANAERFIEAKQEAVRLNLEEPMTEYIEEWPVHPVTGEANDGNRRGPLAPAYRVQASLDEVMALHGLPMAVADGVGPVYSTTDARGGLLAAMLSPDSSRQVAATEALDAMPRAMEGREVEDTPAPSLMVIALALAGALLVVRRRST